ncbi:leukotriene A-4 hydrolase-like protein [Gonapodya prolifera JEL478]|uniref:Leukotriene A-4 hydrolase-like protein n=1 Tax=Gonapodya prolifera (strain JEL478) TaxID=1344416 RepID=A0A139A8G4_GONPJ|nr:leukotriene A-4 hydrolase-like protein [Gonapodya prolifera JEL478]|eukprot:KXS13096.1 leukotriene A-4 hydrolase-like protein [Gonapodya prolifera JEL478]
MSGPVDPPRCPFDPNSLSNPHECIVSHMDISWTVDFDKFVIFGHVDYTCKTLADKVAILALDTSFLEISSCSAVNANGEDRPLKFKLFQRHPAFGSRLEVSLAPGYAPSGSTFIVRVTYTTTDQCTATQWLTPAQTVGRRLPYLFTQCQAIHARSLLPCQDTPGVKASYRAEVKVPQPLVALMSAVAENKPTQPVPSASNPQLTLSPYYWYQQEPIPSYLIALAVGNLESREIGPRSRVWSEPEVVDAAAYEFIDTELFVKTGEDLLTPYVWGRYDILVLPSSFPYGGMENPCLTFVTPTLLAGDRSLVDVIAHEASHSWTGNLVTNRCWEDFWLNEGFTMYVERKIIGRLHGEPARQLSAIVGYRHLKDDVVDHFGEDNLLTALRPNLKDRDPDDAFSAVPYEKGFALLYYLEGLLGGSEIFEGYVRHHVATFAHRSITTGDFRDCLFAYFADSKNLGGGPSATEKLQAVDWDRWFNAPGMPIAGGAFDDTLAKEAEELAKKWSTLATGSATFAPSPADVANFSATQKMVFLDAFDQYSPLSVALLDKMEVLYGWTDVRNAEIRFRWQMLCLRSNRPSIIPKVVEFVGEQGRMKYVRPLYRALNKAQPDGSKVARETFLQLKPTYHPIAASLIEKDLGLAQ